MSHSSDETITIKQLSTDREIMAAFPAMKTLRTDLEEERFLPRIRALFEDGYHLAGLIINNQVVTVAGFRLLKSFSMGKSLYLADLSSIKTEQSRGYGSMMMAWLKKYALEHGCDVIHLDSGVQRHRAHKFYLNKEMIIECYHFVERFKN